MLYIEQDRTLDWLNPESNPLEDLVYLTDYLHRRYDREYLHLTCRRRLYDILRNHPKTIQTYNETFNLQNITLKPSELTELLDAKGILKEGISLYEEHYDIVEKVSRNEGGYLYGTYILDYRYIVIGLYKEYSVDYILQATRPNSVSNQGYGYFQVIHEQDEQKIDCSEDIIEDKKFLCDVIVRWNGEPSNKFKCIAMKSKGRYYYLDGNDEKHEFNYVAYRTITNIQYL